MANTKLPPTPTGVPPGHSFWNDWYERLRDIVNATLVNHNDLQSIQGGSPTERYHLTFSQQTDLTDAGDSALHFHSADRARANHTGTQDHNTTLSGLQGGVAGQYYHLTSAEYTALNGPTFSAYQSTLHSVANSTFTKVQLQSEEFDTASNFDSTTNYRFTPTVAGYYHIDGACVFASSAAFVVVSIFKNGSEFKRGAQSGSAASSGFGGAVSALVFLNGSTDYVELFCLQVSGGSLNTSTGAALTYFQGFLARAS